MREAIEGTGAQLEYLPPYSPDVNPIEPMVVVQFLYHHRTDVEQSQAEIEKPATTQCPPTAQGCRAAFAATTPADCQGFFLHAGYATLFMELF